MGRRRKGIVRVEILSKAMLELFFTPIVDCWSNLFPVLNGVGEDGEVGDFVVEGGEYWLRLLWKS